MPGNAVLSEYPACLWAATKANGRHEAVVTGDKQPNDLPHVRWINTLLSNLQSRLNGTFPAFHFDKDGHRDLGGDCFRCNPNVLMAARTDGTSHPVNSCMLCTEQHLKVVEVGSSSRDP